jgi:hypothetical protein
MFGAEVLDVAIGLVLLFLFLSLICTALVEAAEAILKHRAMDLERGIRELLDDRDGTTITRTFFEHPLIYGLYAGDYDPTRLRRTRKLENLWRWAVEKVGPGRRGAPAGTVEMMAADPTPVRMHMGFWSRRDLPSYIPAGNFSGALLDIVARGATDPNTSPSLAVPTTESLRAGVLTLPNMRLQRAVLAALDASRGDPAQVKASLEAWYDATMDRVSGWYKRRTQGVLFAIGLVLAGILNIDALTVARRLSEDQALRQAAVAQAEQITGSGDAAAETLADLQARSFEDLMGRMQAIGYPMGWEPMPQRRCPVPAAPSDEQQGQGDKPQELTGCPLGARAAVAMVGGWLISALAVMLGAPFWFDLLNKFMVIRATVKPREKSPEEGSEDRQASTPPYPGGRGAAGASAPLAPSAGSGTEAGAVPRIPFEAHRWKDGSEEGDL